MASVEEEEDEEEYDDEEYEEDDEEEEESGEYEEDSDMEYEEESGEYYTEDSDDEEEEEDEEVSEKKDEPSFTHIRRNLSNLKMQWLNDNQAPPKWKPPEVIKREKEEAERKRREEEEERKRQEEERMRIEEEERKQKEEEEAAQRLEESQRLEEELGSQEEKEEDANEDEQEGVGSEANTGDQWGNRRKKWRDNLATKYASYEDDTPGGRQHRAALEIDDLQEKESDDTDVFNLEDGLKFADSDAENGEWEEDGEANLEGMDVEDGEVKRVSRKGHPKGLVVDGEGASQEEDSELAGTMERDLQAIAQLAESYLADEEDDEYDDTESGAVEEMDANEAEEVESGEIQDTEEGDLISATDYTDDVFTYSTDQRETPQDTEPSESICDEEYPVMVGQVFVDQMHGVVQGEVVNVDYSSSEPEEIDIDELISSPEATRLSTPLGSHPALLDTKPSLAPLHAQIVDIYSDDAITTSECSVPQASSEQYEPSSEQYEPSSEQCEPSSEQCEPSLEQFEPSSEAYDPSSGPCDPSSEQYEASSGAFEPSSGAYDASSGPYEASSGPYEASSGLNEGSSEAIENSSAPYEPSSEPYESSQLTHELGTESESSALPIDNEPVLAQMSEEFQTISTASEMSNSESKKYGDSSDNSTNDGSHTKQLIPETRVDSKPEKKLDPVESKAVRTPDNSIPCLKLKVHVAVDEENNKRTCASAKQSNVDNSNVCEEAGIVKASEIELEFVPSTESKPQVDTYRSLPHKKNQRYSVAFEGDIPGEKGNDSKPGITASPSLPENLNEVKEPPKPKPKYRSLYSRGSAGVRSPMSSSFSESFSQLPSLADIKGMTSSPAPESAQNIERNENGNNAVASENRDEIERLDTTEEYIPPASAIHAECIRTDTLSNKGAKTHTATAKAKVEKHRGKKVSPKKRILKRSKDKRRSEVDVVMRERGRKEDRRKDYEVGDEKEAGQEGRLGYQGMHSAPTPDICQSCTPDPERSSKRRSSKKKTPKPPDLDTPVSEEFSVPMDELSPSSDVPPPSFDGGIPRSESRSKEKKSRLSRMRMDIPRRRDGVKATRHGYRSGSGLKDLEENSTARRELKRSESAKEDSSGPKNGAIPKQRKSRSLRLKKKLSSMSSTDGDSGGEGEVMSDRAVSPSSLDLPLGQFGEEGRRKVPDVCR